MSLVKRTSKGFVWNQASKIIEFILLFLFNIVVARGLGPQQYGIYSLIITVSAFFLLFCSNGFEQTLNIFLSKLDTEEKTYLLRNLFILRMLSVSIISLILYFYSPKIAQTLNIYPNLIYLRLAIFYIFFESWNMLLFYVFIGQLQANQTFVVKLVNKLAALIFAYIAIRQGWGIPGVILVLAGASLLSVLIYLYKLKKDISGGMRKFNLFPIYKTSITLWVTEFVNLIINKQIDIILLGVFLISASNIGYYNIAFTLTITLSTLLLGGLEGISLSSLSEIAAKRDKRSLEKGWRILIKISVFLSVPILIFAIYFSKPLIQSLYSDVYLSAAILFQVFAIFGFMNRLLGGGAHITVLYAIGKERLALWLRISAGLTNLILDILLIPHYGAMGAIIATGFSSTAMLLVEFLVVRRYLCGAYPTAFVAKILCVSLLSLGLVTLIPITNIFSLVLAGAAYGLAHVVFLYLIKPLEFEDKELLLKVNKTLSAILGSFAK